MGIYKVSAGSGSFQLGKPGQEGTIKARVGDEVELSDEQLKQLERLSFEFTAVNSTTEPPPQEQKQQSQEPQDPQEPQEEEAPVASTHSKKKKMRK